MTDAKPELHMYKEEVDTVIAESKEDAAKVWAEHVGGDYREERDGDDPVECWEQIPDDKPVTLAYPEEDAATMTAAEWCAKDGRCFWGSTEY